LDGHLIGVVVEVEAVERIRHRLLLKMILTFLLGQLSVWQLLRIPIQLVLLVHCFSL
jgi:hypothetical protein